MFTGIITDVGRITGVERLAVGRRLTIATAYETAGIDLGASIACNGACLTVVEKGPSSFAADVSGETDDKTTSGDWDVGTRINLERALRAADELGGHLVLGHVDGVGSVTRLQRQGDNHRVAIEVPAALKHYIASKGSVTVDGVSLTVNEVDDAVFGVNIIPHTWENTSLADLLVGAGVNIEVDVIARYVARLLERE
ncbi:MAG: riboflavin synthase [Rhodospirillaceae bacterium]|mgnify:CR=1 FL=1|nr:riboflavin synthase [Rhodospirillaceae bacterium]